jgi:hypothetical protein
MKKDGASGQSANVALVTEKQRTDSNGVFADEYSR